MVVKRRLLLAAASALTLVMVAAAPMMGAYREAKPSPLRAAGLVRVKDIAANGNTSKGAIVAVGYQETSKPGRLYVAFSTDGGKDYRRSNGNLRRYPIVGHPSLGMSLSVCDGRVWVGTAAKVSNGARAVLSSRTIGGGGNQAWVTPEDGRAVRDVSVACVGKDLMAVSWLEKKDGQTRARLFLRSMEQLGAEEVAVERKYIIDTGVELKSGIDVAATPDQVVVGYVKGGNLRLARYGISSLDPVVIKEGPPATIASQDIKDPVVAARGNKVVVAYADAGKVKAKLSGDQGAGFGGPKVLINTGGVRNPSKPFSVDVVGDRVVVEAQASKKGDLTPQRIQSTDFGEKWGTRSFGHIGARTGALMKKKGKEPMLREAWHNNAASPAADTLRTKYETP